MGLEHSEYIGQWNHIDNCVINALDAISKCILWGCFELQLGFVSAKASLNSDGMKVSCSIIPARNIIIMVNSIVFS